MKIARFCIDQLTPVCGRSVVYPGFVVVILAVFALGGSCLADDQVACMSELMKQASDSTTVGELREQCSQQVDDEAHSEIAAVDDKPATAVDVRLNEDKENVLQPFTLMAHKPNYFLLGAYNQKGYSAELYQEQFDDPSLTFDDTEAQFQISLKVPLAVDLFDTFDVYAAYTNRSFWQLYNSDVSAPFRETNHEPEAWVQFTPAWEIFGFTNSANTFGFVHQSNGRGGVLSRSWNRVYANFVFQRGNFALGFKPWIRISEDAEDDDNPDITDYLGHYELRAGYKWNNQVFSLMSRNNLESGFDHGAVELGWSFPLWNYPYLKGYIQYFGGYGESLIDYDQKSNRIGIGISLTDWL
jgi:phospholipase A1